MRKEGAEKGREKSRQAASYGLLIALAMIFGYIESLLPLPVPVPGMKIGLANLVTIVCLEFVGIRGAVWVTLLRVVLTGLSFGNPYSMIYGLSGSFLSLAVMAAAKHYRLFSRTGISILGGVFHNVGQLVFAAWILRSAAVFSYLPALLIAGTAAGAVIGAVGGMLAGRLQRFFRYD